MKFSGSALIAPFLVLVLSNGCSSGDDDDGGAGTAGSTAGSATAGSGGSTAGTGGTGGSSAGTGGSSAGTGGSSAGSGGSSAGTGGSSAGSASTDSPSDTTQAGIDAFIDAASYKGVDWVSDVGTPRLSEDPAHGMVRVWFNKTLRQSDFDMDTTSDTGSMVVKEFYDDANALVGHGVLLRTATGWIYHCDSSAAGRCNTTQVAGMKIYGTSATSTNCACHGAGNIITETPPP